MIIPNQSHVIYNAMMPDGNATRGELTSNTVNTEVLSYAVSKSIRSDKTFVRNGEVVRNTVTVTNNSSTRLFDNRVTIPTPDGASFVAGSVKINGVAQPTYDPATGFVVPDLDPGETVVIEYEIKIDGHIPTAPITCFATLDHTVSDPVRGDVKYTENTDSILVNAIVDKIVAVKSVDKAFAVTGETLHYTVTIVNAGNITKSGMVFKDPIPDGTTFVPNSVKFNGIGYPVYHPEIGFVIRSLTPGEAFTVEFDVLADRKKIVTNVSTVTDRSGAEPIAIDSNAVQTVVRSDPDGYERCCCDLVCCCLCAFDNDCRCRDRNDTDCCCRIDIDDRHTQ